MRSNVGTRVRPRGSTLDLHESLVQPVSQVRGSSDGTVPHLALHAVAFRYPP
jgi:hypothetical protein